LLEDGMDIMTLKDLWDIKCWDYNGIPAYCPTWVQRLVHSIRFCTMQSEVADVQCRSKIESYGLNTRQLLHVLPLRAELGGHIDACDDWKHHHKLTLPQQALSQVSGQQTRRLDPG
jgi:hypothetical protein